MQGEQEQRASELFINDLLGLFEYLIHELLVKLIMIFFFVDRSMNATKAHLFPLLLEASPEMLFVEDSMMLDVWVGQWRVVLGAKDIESVDLNHVVVFLLF